MAMSEEKKSSLHHSVTIDRRENVSITGILDVISFDEETIIAETELGVLILRGNNLHVNRLNLENGDLEIDGEISGMNYEEQNSYSKGKPSMLGKLFR